MTTCADGHRSASDDYCDVCGAPIRPAGGDSGAVPPAVPPTRPPAGPCANCGAPLDGRFCEVCGHDATTPAIQSPQHADSAVAGAPTVSASAGMTTGSAAPSGSGAPLFAVVLADRAWYDAVRTRGGPDADAVEFPPYCPERRFALTGQRIAIGRRSRSRGTHPDIDLSGPPLDPGISAQQALLLAGADGGWRVVDLDSTNGTVIATAASAEFGEPIPPGEPVAVADGDRIHLGAWTTITLTSAPGSTT